DAGHYQRQPAGAGLRFLTRGRRAREHAGRGGAGTYRRGVPCSPARARPRLRPVAERMWCAVAGGLVGANPDQLDALAARMDGDAAALSSVRDSIQWSLGRTDWPGADGDQFRSDWAYRYAPALANAATMLRDAARVLRVN